MFEHKTSIIEQEVYWQKQQANESPILQLPFDHPLSGKQAFTRQSETFEYDEDFRHTLRSFCQQEKIALFTLFLTTFKIMLRRYTGQEDIIVGTLTTDTSIKTPKETSSRVDNPIPLRTQLAANLTAKTVLSRIDQTIEKAGNHQVYAPKHLAKQINDNGSPSVFQVMFIGHNLSATSLDTANLATAVSAHTTGSDLVMVASEEAEILTITVHYNAELFESKTIKRLLGHFQSLLAGIMANPDRPISQLPLLTETERHQILVEWNDTQADYPDKVCIHQLFEAQVEKTPDAVAVDYQNEQITYEELNRQANRLAHHLQSLGVGPDVLVGICLDRSIEMIVAMLATLKAGGAYLPLDPTNPPDRLAFMLADAQAPLLLTHSDLVKTLPKQTTRHICLDTEAISSTLENEANPSSQTTASHLAYVIYTSGSTGKPKGVQLEHRGLVNLVCWHQHTFNVTAADRATQLAGLSFDAAVWEIWPYLTAGAMLHLPPDEETRVSPEHLRDWLVAQQITLTFVPTPLAEKLIRLDWSNQVSLRSVLVGGDKLHTYPDPTLPFALINNYGPTEYTVVTTSTTVPTTTQIEQPPSIGRPITNSQVYILDTEMQPVPIGIPGELHVGGPGLARGYLDRPELTAERFVPNPFSAQPEARLYKTGDLVRYRPDGQIEFLGRIDHQVKIRGYRIELGEIETTLAQHPAVREALVMAREDTPGDQRLVAYIVPTSQTPPSINEWRAYLTDKLPTYMIPAAFVILEAFPLNPNGKIDRHALPVPDVARPDLADTFVPPDGPVEKMLADIWQAVLGVEQVGRHDDFFELGGHSLLATQIIARLRQKYEIDLPLRKLFELSTIADLAVTIEKILLPEIEAIRLENRKVKRMALNTSPVSETPKLSTADRRELLEKRLKRKYKQDTPSKTDIPQRAQSSPAPLSHTQEGIWYLEQLQPDTATYNMTFAWRMRGPLDVGALQKSLNRIVQRHEALRTHFEIIGDRPMQVITPELTLPLKIIDLGHLPETDQAPQMTARIYEAAYEPFNLTQAPLFRAVLVKLAPDDYTLALTLHHLVGDGWSFGLLRRELAACYQAFATDAPPVLPELPVQYADFAIWQRERLAEEPLDKQLAYWRNQLDGAPPVIDLPTDYNRPPNQNYEGDSLSLILPPSLNQKLKRLGQQENATPFMVLLTAFKILLQRLTGQDDIIVGTPKINRNQVETENLIGYFLNNLVLRTDLSGELTFRDLLKRVRETTFDAYSHQDYPFEKLVQALQPERNLSYTPLFQIFFNMFNAFENEELELSGLTLESISRTSIEEGSKFDFTLYVLEAEEDLHFQLVYRTSLFRRERMVEMLAQYEQLLVQIAENPDRQMADCSLVTPQAKQILPDPTLVLSEPSQTLVTQMVNRWAEHPPPNPAITQGNRRWSYSQLVEQAHHLAQTLRISGVESGDSIAIYAPRSFGLIASMLGVMLSGGVLVLLDPLLPDSRKQLMLQEAQVKHLILIPAPETDNSWLSPEDKTLNILCVESTSGQVVGNDAKLNTVNTSLPEVTPDDPAYIFFTSGTTGKPKGVLGCHKGLSHFLSWQGETFDIGPGDRAAQLTGLSFDVVLRDIFLPLTHGATLCLPESLDNLVTDNLLRWLDKEGITSMHTVPALAQTWLVTAPDDAHLTNLRLTFFAGEPLTDTLVRRWREVFPKTEIINLYGPTETTLAKCYYTIPPEPHPGVQPVGRPMPQTQALVLAPNNRLCGLGETGEIVLRTPFRSYGYVNVSPEQQQQFVQNPFRDDQQDILYFTGDLGRYRLDGTLDILGRRDDQVKVRGVRIELGEIIATLTQHPMVKVCTVVKKEDQGQAYLVAYVVLKVADSVTQAELRTFLDQRLLPAMVPSAFVMLDEMPLTANGKVNRRHLPEPDLANLEQKESFVAPRTPLEAQLAQIWADVLGLEQVGIHDNFFELGGHSLLAIRLLAQIERMTGQKLPLMALFQASTIAQLSKRLDQQQPNGQSRSLIPLRTNGHKMPIFGLPGNLGNVHTDLGLLTQYLPTEYPFYALQDGLHNPLTIRGMATQYISEIRTIQPEGPYLLVGICSGGTVAFEMAHQLRAQGQSVALLALIEPANLVTFKLLSYLKMAFSVTRRFALRASYHANNMSHVSRSEQRDYAKLKHKLITNMFASRRYKARLYPGQLDLFLTVDTLQKQNKGQLAWLQWATETTLHEIPGNHETITGTGDVEIDEVAFKMMSDKLTKRIEEALQG